MDGTRARRTRDRARQGWYARHRQWRFARFLGFPVGPEAPIGGMSVVRSAAGQDRPTIGMCAGLTSIGLGATSPTAQPYVGSLMVAVG
jgi:hypothetical protein